MRTLLKLYLCGYFLVIAAAVATIWRSGLIAHLDRGWTYGTIAGAILLGVLLALTSRKPRTTPADSEHVEE